MSEAVVQRSQGHERAVPARRDRAGLANLAKKYLEHLLVLKWSARTVYQRTKLLQYFAWYCRRRGISNALGVTKAVLSDYQAYLHSYRRRNGQALAIGTQDNWLGAVLMFFRWLSREKLIPRNPALDIERPRGASRLPRTVLNTREVETVLRVPDVSTPLGLRDRAMLEVLYATGIRRLELCRLKLADVDPVGGWLRVEQGKGRKDRVVPIGGRALKWISRYQNAARPRLCRDGEQTALFVSTRGRAISPERLSSRVHELMAKAHIGKTGACHVFRHTFATLLVENGCDIRHVQEMLGHADLSTTALYTHLCPVAVREAYRHCHPAEREAAPGPEQTLAREAVPR